MNNLEIAKAIAKEKPEITDKFVGVFSADTIPEKEYHGAYIVNTDDANQSGQHWVAFYCSENGTLEAFDSFGKNPGSYSQHIKAWMGDDYVIRSDSVLQSSDSTLCGNYCLYFVLLRCYGISYEDLLSVFCGDSRTSDLFICRFINKYFKIKTKIQDRKFLIESLIKHGRTSR